MSSVSRSGPLLGHRSRLMLVPRRLALGWMVQPLIIFAATRAFVFLAGYLASVALPARTGEGLYHLEPNNVSLDMWARWDSAYYVAIAQNGYGFTNGQLRDVAFFPVYPLLVKLMSGLTIDVVLAGVLVSNLTFLGVLLLLDRLTHLEFADAGTTARSVFYLAAFPSSVFFSAVYSESTFVVFALGSMYCARRRWWVAAGTLAAVSAATRVIGIVLWPVLILEWLAAHGWTVSALRDRVALARLVARSRRDWASLVAIAVTPLGLASYVVFLGKMFQDPLAFWTAQALWDKDSRGPVLSVLTTIDRMQWGDVWTGADVYWNAPLDLGAVMMAVGIGVAVFRRLGAGYGLFVLLAALMPLWSSTVSMLRYVVVLFPLFMLLGQWGRRPLVDRAVSATFLVLLGLSTAIFTNWGFLA